MPLNPPTVSAPLPVHPVEVGTISEAPADLELEALDKACTEAHHLEAAGRKAKPRASRLLTQQQGNPSFTPRLGGTSAKHDQTKDQVPTYESEREPLKDASATRICPRAIQLLDDLKAASKRIPNETPRATHAHRLSVFTADPRTCVAEPGEDDWPILNGMLKTAFGWGEAEMAAAIPEMLNRREQGLDGFIQFMQFFVDERGLEGVLFETKVEALCKELDNR